MCSAILVTKSSVLKSFKNSTGGEECRRLVFSSLRPVLKELGTTKILLQSQLYLLNQRVDLTQARRHCAPSLDLDPADCFHPILHHFHRLHQPFLRDGREEGKKILKSRYMSTRVGGSGGPCPPEAEENTIFFTLKMQFQGLLTHKLLGPSINATPKLLPKL